MKSTSTLPHVSFAALQERLLRFVNERIQNGDLSERCLARLLGISQPQMHHVLKGTRKLQPAVADRLSARFEITVLDLIESEELYAALFSREPLVLEQAAAPPTSPGIHVAPSRFESEIPRKKPTVEIGKSRESEGRLA